MMEQQNKDNFKVSFDFAKTPITQIADYIIIAASKLNTSDIHFDPRENGMMVRFRIDGDLQDYSFIPKAYERNLTTRLKLLANMNITESRLPQDGAIKGTFGDTYLDMRVSCLPLNEGEKIVIRILDYTRSLQGIDSLGFHPDNLKKLKRMMMTPNGIILVTGATGSGKSTTTYSILQELNTPNTNIITVEDPIEMNIQGINQVQVNAEIGMTFAAALRSILRQDPNVILIGEIRDSETAQIAVRSAITGHLVLSTIHTNNSLSTIERLLDMDVERYLLSTALTGIISQRLAKSICPQCRFQRKTTPYEQKIFKNFLKLDVQTIWDANPDGCPNCRKGYKGRIAIQEVLELDDEIRSALTIEDLKKDDLRKMVYTDKTITMLQDALIKCINGETSFEEVYRVIEMENDDDEDYKSELTAAIHEAITSPEAIQEAVAAATNIDMSQATENTKAQESSAEQPIEETNNTETIQPVETAPTTEIEQPVVATAEEVPNTEIQQPVIKETSMEAPVTEEISTEQPIEDTNNTRTIQPVEIAPTTEIEQPVVATAEEVPNTEIQQPVIEETSMEAPVTEIPNVEYNQPVIDESSTEQPIEETNNTETVQPVETAPATEIEQPVTEETSMEAPVTEIPTENNTIEHEQPIELSTEYDQSASTKENDVTEHLDDNIDNSYTVQLPNIIDNLQQPVSSNFDDAYINDPPVNAFGRDEKENETIISPETVQETTLNTPLGTNSPDSTEESNPIIIPNTDVVITPDTEV